MTAFKVGQKVTVGGIEGAIDGIFAVEGTWRVRFNESEFGWFRHEHIEPVEELIEGGIYVDATGRELMRFGGGWDLPTMRTLPTPYPDDRMIRPLTYTGWRLVRDEALS